MRIHYSKKYDFCVEEASGAQDVISRNLLYNDYNYLSVWPGKFFSFYLINKSKDEVNGLLQVRIDHHNAWSPYKAPFSSFYFSRNTVLPAMIAFIDFCIQQLRELGVNKIYLKHYPDFYTSHSPDKIISAIFFSGFQINTTDINHHLVLDQPFESLIDPMQKRRLNKCIRLAFKYNLAPNNETESVFRKIQMFRSQKKIPVNIDMKEIKELVKRFPDDYQAVTVTDNDQVIAASLTVKVNEQVIYQFLPASDPAYNSSSPMVFLIKGLYTHALSGGFKYIDMGVSSLNGKPQSDLIRFKERLGCKTGMKFSFIKSLK